MLTAMMLSVMLVAGDDGLAPRVQTLIGHVDRLEMIAAPAALEGEKQAKLADLRAVAARCKGFGNLQCTLRSHR